MLAAGTLSGSIAQIGGTSVAAPQIVRQIAGELGNVVAVCDADRARLGEYIFEPDTDSHIPSRRYRSAPKGKAESRREPALRMPRPSGALGAI